MHVSIYGGVCKQMKQLVYENITMIEECSSYIPRGGQEKQTRLTLNACLILEDCIKS